MTDQKDNNLQVFRKEVRKFQLSSQAATVSQEQQALSISSHQQLKNLVNHLCNQKLLHPTEVQKLITKIQPVNFAQNSLGRSGVVGDSALNVTQPQTNEFKTKKKLVSFPLLVKQFQNIIMVQFSDQNCQNLITDLKRYKTLLKQIKGVLNVWKYKGLTNQQKSQLESIFAKGNQKISNLCQLLKKKKEVLENVSEQQIQMIKSLNEWVQMQRITQKFKHYSDFQKYNKQTINSLFNKIQVKQAYFKKKQIDLKLLQQITVVKGFNSKNDEPIDIVLITKNSINFSKVNKQLIRFDALKQLSLSEYFPKFLGFNCHSNPTSIQYFVSASQTKNLNALMKSQKALSLSYPLLKYWMYQIYKTFYDIYLMCTYQPELPIKMQDFQVKDYGLQIILKNISFTQKRQKTNLNKTQIDPLQTKLLQNLGVILLNLLNINPIVPQIDEKLDKLQEKCFFKSLIKVVQSHKNFQNSIVQNRLSFFNLQTHPLLEESHFCEGTQIIQNFIAIFGNQ